MADKLFSHQDISVGKGFLGLGTKVTYTPTNSKVAGIWKDFNEENGRIIRNLLKATPEEMAQFVQNPPTVQSADYGSYRLEACVSADRQFAALQLLHYADFLFEPVTDVRFFEGDELKAIAGIL